MNSKQYHSLLKFLLRFGCGYMVFEALYHFSGIRISGAEDFWPESAVKFIFLFMTLWASASLFMAVILFYCQKYYDQAKPLIFMLAFPMLLHTLLVFWLSFTPYPSILPLPRLYVWSPFYQWILRAEGAALLGAAGLILYGKSRKYL